MQIKLINKDTDGEQVHTVVNFLQQMCQAYPHADSKHWAFLPLLHQIYIFFGCVMETHCWNNPQSS